MRLAQVLCWLEKLMGNADAAVAHFGLTLPVDERPAIMNRVRRACIQWAREGGGHEHEGSINPKGNTVLWAILFFLDALARKNTPPGVVVKKKKPFTDGKNEYKAEDFYTLAGLHEYLWKHKSTPCPEIGPRPLDRRRPRSLRWDPLGKGDAPELKAKFLHNLLRRAEAGAEAEKERQRVIQDAQAEALRVERERWANLPDYQKRLQDQKELEKRVLDEAAAKAAPAADAAARRTARAELPNAQGLVDSVWRLERPEVVEGDPEEESEQEKAKKPKTPQLAFMPKALERRKGRERKEDVRSLPASKMDVNDPDNKKFLDKLNVNLGGGSADPGPAHKAPSDSRTVKKMQQNNRKREAEKNEARNAEYEAEKQARKDAEEAAAAAAKAAADAQNAAYAAAQTEFQDATEAHEKAKEDLKTARERAEKQRNFETRGLPKASQRKAKQNLANAEKAVVEAVTAEAEAQQRLDAAKEALAKLHNAEEEGGGA